MSAIFKCSEFQAHSAVAAILSLISCNVLLSLQLAMQFFVARLVANVGCHTRKFSSCNLQRNANARKIASCDMALRHSHLFNFFFSQYSVSYLIITNRADCCSERLSNFEIRIGNSLADNGNQNPKCGGNYSMPNLVTKNISCPAPLEGRYVNVRIPGSWTYLTLCEVEIFGQGNHGCYTTLIMANILYIYIYIYIFL